MQSCFESVSVSLEGKRLPISKLSADILWTYCKIYSVMKAFFLLYITGTTLFQHLNLIKFILNDNDCIPFQFHSILSVSKIIWKCHHKLFEKCQINMKVNYAIQMSLNKPLVLDIDKILQISKYKRRKKYKLKRLTKQRYVLKIKS